MLILVGKTCSGKDTIKKELVKLGMIPITTYTTRPMRDGEVNGEAYHFISKEEFLKKVEDGFFAECTYYNDANGDTWYYGSVKKDYVENGVMISNPNGVKDLLYLHQLNPLVVYVKASNKTIVERLINRGDDIEEAKRRIQSDAIDFMNMDRIRGITISNNGEYSPREIAEKIYDVYKTLRR